MELLIQREPTEHGTTYGKMQVNGSYQCETLEDPIRELPKAEGESAGAWVARWKVKGDTAIPAGRYRVVIDFSRRFHRLMPHVLDVAGFDGIRLHALNTAAETEGCPGVGRERINFGTKDKPIPGIGFSGPAFGDLFELLRRAFFVGEEIWITIANPGATP
jgi:hypothetical protein